MQQDYNDSNIRTLSGLEHIRHRPEMSMHIISMRLKKGRIQTGGKKEYMVLNSGESILLYVVKRP